MDDTVRISAERFREVYEAGFQTWASLYCRAKENPRFPASLIFQQHDIPQHPILCRDLILRRDESRIFASGMSNWGSTTDCNKDPLSLNQHHNLPFFKEPVQIEVASTDPLLLCMSALNPDRSYASWFACSDDYLAILMLAWAYILSARWVELMPTTTLQYTENQAAFYNDSTGNNSEEDSIRINIGHAGSEKIRWWAAVLAQGQGWQATMGGTFSSPWTICLQCDLPFSVSSPSNTTPWLLSATSFKDACNYLTKFCVRHNVVDQSHVALAAVLLFPSLRGQNLHLPRPKARQWKPSPNLSSRTESQYDWLYRDKHLERLLTMSCNTRSIRPMLLSVFYQPEIECKAVSPWLQGCLSAITTLTSDDSCVFGRMCAERTPTIGCFWLGGTILGLHDKLLQQHVQYGLIPIDIYSASWTGTIQSFIQQPVSEPLVANDEITRADECILLFLSRPHHHTQVPICQWKPFGRTLIQDLDLEVRAHLKCKGHRLQYRGFEWDSHGSILESPVSAGATQYYPSFQPTQDTNHRDQIPVSFEGFNRENEVISENASRSILSWLRNDGYTKREEDVWKHHWFNILDSDDESDDYTDVRSDKSSNKIRLYRGDQPLSQVELWIRDLPEEGIQGLDNFGKILR
jgi:hypothetical protein